MAPSLGYGEACWPELKHDPLGSTDRLTNRPTDDPQACLRPISALLAPQGSQDREAAESRNVSNARGGREA